jgi:hypothetical protein
MRFLIRPHWKTSYLDSGMIRAVEGAGKSGLCSVTRCHMSCDAGTRPRLRSRYEEWKHLSGPTRQQPLQRAPTPGINEPGYGLLMMPSESFRELAVWGALDSHRVWNLVCSLSKKLRWLRNYAEDPAPSHPASKSIQLQIAAVSSVRLLLGPHCFAFAAVACGSPK